MSSWLVLLAEVVEKVMQVGAGLVEVGCCLVLCPPGEVVVGDRYRALGEDLRAFGGDAGGSQPL